MELIESLKLKESWKRWVQDFQIFLEARGLSQSLERVESSILLHVGGPEALQKEHEGHYKMLAKILQNLQEYRDPGNLGKVHFPDMKQAVRQDHWSSCNKAKSRELCVV